MSYVIQRENPPGWPKLEYDIKMCEEPCKLDPPCEECAANKNKENRP